MTTQESLSQPQELPEPWNAMLNDISTARALEEERLLAADEIERLMSDQSNLFDPPGAELLAQSVATPDRILSALRPLGEKIGSAATRDIRNALAILADFSFVDVSYSRLGVLLAGLPIPSLMAPLIGSNGSPVGLIAVDHACASLYLDAVLGGGQAQSSPMEGGRPYSAIETKLFEGFVAAGLAAIGPSLLPHCDIALSSKGIETQPRYLALGKYSDSVIRFRFTFQIEKRKGLAEVIFTGDVLAALEKAFLPPRLEQKLETDDVWRRRLVTIAAAASIDLDFVLAEVQFSLRHLQSLKIGDTLPLGISQTTPISIQSHKANLGKALIGRAGSKMAVRMMGPVTAS